MYSGSCAGSNGEKKQKRQSEKRAAEAAAAKRPKPSDDEDDSPPPARAGEGKAAPPLPAAPLAGPEEPEAEFDGEGAAKEQVTTTFPLSRARFDELSETIEKTLAARSAALSRLRVKLQASAANLAGQKVVVTDRRSELQALPPRANELERVLAQDALDEAKQEVTRFRAEGGLIESDVATVVTLLGPGSSSATRRAGDRQ